MKVAHICPVKETSIMTTAVWDSEKGDYVANCGYCK